MQNLQSPTSPEIRKIGLFGAQEVELHTGNAQVYIGRRPAGTLGTVLRQNGHGISLNVKTEVEEQILAQELAKEKLRLSKIHASIQIDNHERFLRTMTHLIAKERPHGKSDEDHFIRNELDAVLDDVKEICRNGKSNRTP